MARFKNIILGTVFSVLLPSVATAQELTLTNNSGYGIIKTDTSTNANASCPEGLDPIVISLDHTKGTGFHKSSHFDDPTRKRIIISRATERTINSRTNREQSGVRFSAVRQTTPTFLITGTLRPSSPQEPQLGVTIKACYSELGFTVRTGRFVVEGQVGQYETRLDESFDALTTHLNAGLSVSHQRIILNSGPSETPVLWDGFSHPLWVKHPVTADLSHMPVLGKTAIETSKFPWRFAALKEGNAEMDGTLSLAIRLVMLDARDE